VPSARTRPCEKAAIQSIRVVRDCAASAKPWVLLATILASSLMSAFGVLRISREADAKQIGSE
jgi:hypothetical protein